MTNEELVSFLKKNPISVGCGVLSLALLAATYFRSDLIPEADAALVEKSAEAERYAANIKNSAQLKEQHEALVAANKEIDARVVRPSQLGTNSQIFYKLVSEAGVKLNDFRQNTSPSAKLPAKAAFLPVSFSIAVQGDLTQVLSLLHVLESGAHYCRIMTGSCAVTGATPDGPLTLTLTLEMLGLP